MAEKLKSFPELVKYLSEQFGVPAEVVEAIIVEWVKVLYLSTTGREPNDDVPDLWVG